ncbi:MAG: cell division protein FtsI [Desulfobacterales bacterium]|nr:MAG: cell division protein FtsI [Desulfobacterales bacterium]
MATSSKDRIGTRIFILRMGLMLCLAGLGAASVKLQVFDRDILTRKAEQSQSARLTIQGDRGRILDRNMNKLATSIDAPNITADPKQVGDPQQTAAALSKVLGIKTSTLKKQLVRDKRFVILAKRVSRKQAAAVKALNLKGIYQSPNTKRFYPNRELAAQLIGFTGEDKGLEGIELKYNEVLKGDRSKTKVLKDGDGRLLDINRLQRNQLRGNTIVLTIDKKIQYLSEQAIKQTVTANRAKSGMALVMNPTTGELLAVAHYPQFNPNNYQDYTQFSFRNRAVTDAFEPGSIMKVFTVAAAIEKGMAPKSIFYCENGRYRIGQFTVKDTHPHQWLSLAQIIKFSSNIGAAKITETIGAKTLYHYLTAFGFGKKTNADMPGEIKGRLHAYQKWSQIDAGAISFGQGLSVTGIQLITAISAIANQGKLMKPMLIKQIITNTGESRHTFRPTVIRQVVSKNTADIIKRMMNQVVRKEGTGAQAAIEGYRVCGKTSTAQKAARHKRGYEQGKYIAAFGGFAPQNNPRLAILVVVDEPREEHFGGQVAAPTFKKIMRNSFNYLNIPPENTDAMIAAVPSHGTTKQHPRRDTDAAL